MLQFLPFGGLGFDLSSVLARAQLLTRPQDQRIVQEPVSDTSPVLGGYDLLVWIGCEIRGQ